jgi:hypothetical protein
MFGRRVSNYVEITSTGRYWALYCASPVCRSMSVDAQSNDLSEISSLLALEYTENEKCKIYSFKLLYD